MAISYKSIEFRVHEYLVQIQDILTLLEADDEMLKKIEESKELIKTKKYRVAVMGEFKRGKSSLINALLGQKILPADVEPATATMNRITYGSRQKVVVEFKDGRFQEVPIEELSDYVTKLTSEGALRASTIEEAVVYSPTVICQNHVDIIDTPGLNDNEAMTKITIDLIDNVDAVIVAIHARSPFSTTERDFVCQLLKSDKINNLVFVVTYMDQLDEDDYVYEDFIEFIRQRICKDVMLKLEADEESESVKEKATRILNDIHIYGISSILALRYFTNNDRKVYEKSRFEAFKSELMQILTAKQVENAVQITVNDIQRIKPDLETLKQVKEKQFESELLALRKNAEMIHEYCDKYTFQLNQSFNENFQVMENIVLSLNQMKNETTRGFIKELSKIKVDSHEVIKTAILDASELQCRKFNDDILKKKNAELLEILYPIYEEFNELRNIQLGNSIQDIGLFSQFDITKTGKEVSELTMSSFRSISFVWKDSIVPRVSDLSQCNVIHDIADVIDLTVNQLIKEYQGHLDAIRMSLFKKAHEDASKLKEMTDKIVSVQLHEIEVKIKAYSNNYEVFYRTAETIIENSQQIIKELEA